MSMQGNAGLRNVSTRIKWNPDITKSQGAGKMCFLSQGVRYIGILFRIHFTITGPKNIVLYTGVFVVEAFVISGSTVIELTSP